MSTTIHLMNEQRRISCTMDKLLGIGKVLSHVLTSRFVRIIFRVDTLSKSGAHYVQNISTAVPSL